MNLQYFRGKDIGGRRQLTETCLQVLRLGQGRQLFSVLPHICLIRSKRFLSPLMRRLRSDLTSERLFAAIALGSLGDRRAVDPLARLFMRPESLRGPGCQSLQTAIIFALGETGAEEAIEPLLQILRVAPPKDSFSRRRRCLVVTALGTLAQHGSGRAVAVLLEASDWDDARLRARAASELGVAFWHCPNALPDDVWRRLTECLADPDETVREAAETAIDNLAQLGCRRAEAVFE